ncbi:hypothetical protein D1007_18732 [Hordeum vulgare]|nr:hypothetical protein D1007_18732 [Hordeum vulgare]
MDFDSPVPTGRPFATVHMATTTPTLAQRAEVALAAVEPCHAFSADLGQAHVAKGSPAPSSSTLPPPPARAFHLALTRASGILWTAASTPAPHLDLIPRLDLGYSDTGPSARSGLPPSITHFFSSKLNPDSGNYNKWRWLFYVAACKYNVQHHLDDTADPVI